MNMSSDVLMHTYPPQSVTFVRGRGTELWDDQGKRYLDFLAGIAVISLGHAHPGVAEAVAEQARTLTHVSNLFGTTIGPDVAATLDRLIGGGGRVFFCNSGAEANEAAIKLARKWGGRGKYAVVSAYNSFHGRTLATLHATGQPAKADAFVPGDHATTFGGQPLAASAAKAVLATMEDLDVPTLAEKAGARLTDALEALDGVTGVRGLGLLLGVELAAGNAKAVAATLLERGLIVNAV